MLATHVVLATASGYRGLPLTGSVIDGSVMAWVSFFVLRSLPITSLFSTTALSMVGLDSTRGDVKVGVSIYWRARAGRVLVLSGSLRLMMSR